MKILVIGIIGIIVIVMGTVTYSMSLNYERDVRGHLKRAADANQPEIALKELDTALAGMAKRNLDRCDPEECFTSVFVETPDEDIGFWHANIQSARDELAALPPNADSLTVSNALMKLRETLLDNTDSGDEVTEPSGISRYPNNGLIGFIGLLVGGIFVVPFIFPSLLERRRSYYGSW